MFGLIVYHATTLPAIDGVRFRAVFVSEGGSLLSKRSARAAARRLRREGVRCAVFPPDYPHRGIFARYGVLPPQLAPLYRASAVGIVRRYMAQRGVDARCATVSFVARSAAPELCRCVETLCGEARYVSLSVPQGGDELAERLRRRFGVAVLDAARHADLTVVFDDSSADGEALRLDDGLGVVYDSEYPNELLAALYLAGALDADALRVVSVTPADMAFCR